SARRTGRLRRSPGEASAAAPLQRRRRTPLSSALETSSSRRRGPAISSEARAKRSKNFTAGAVAETPGATQSITTLASTTGIELARTFAAIRQDKITGRLAGRGTPSDLAGGSAPFGQRDEPCLLDG